jgi:NADPH2:quinone reductase
MRAVAATRPGPPDVLQAVELPTPHPCAGEVLVAVSVAATTFIDTQVRAGNGPRPLAPEDFPVVLGNGVAGTVVEVGDGVDRSWLGARVVTTTGGRGGYADHAVAAADDLHRITGLLDDETAAAVLADGRTALALARAAAIRSGETVAVTAAAGGVGSLIVQLAREATVVALAGDDRKLAHARSLGAPHAISYREPGWRGRLDAAVPALDVVFDGVGGGVSGDLAARVAPGGRFVQYGAASGSWGEVAEVVAARGATLIPLHAVAGDPEELRLLVEEALELAASRRLRPTVGQTFPLDRAADAHTAMEARRTLGKTLLIVSGRDQ